MHFPILGPPKFTQVGIFGLQINHLATLLQTRLSRSCADEDCDDDFGAEIVASICSGVEDRGWDAKELLRALLDGGKTSIFDAAEAGLSSDPVANPASDAVKA
jgi:hypothetical protein